MISISRFVKWKVVCEEVMWICGGELFGGEVTKGWYKGEGRTIGGRGEEQQTSIEVMNEILKPLKANEWWETVMFEWW